MKLKLFNLVLILTSLIGYLEWGKGQCSFLVQMEYEVFSKLVSDPLSVLHPLIILPFAGQLFLLFTLFQKKPGKIFSYLGLAGIGILIVLMFFIGIISLNYKIILSTLPFLVTAFLTIRHLRYLKRSAAQV